MRVVLADHRQHARLTVVLGIGVVVGKRVLLQKVLADHTRDLKRDLVLRAERILADELHDLVEVRFLLQHRHGPLAVFEEFVSQVLAVPRAQGIEIERIGIQPVDGREVASVGK